jgi:hypothetical protein
MSQLTDLANKKITPQQFAQDVATDLKTFSSMPLGQEIVKWALAIFEPLVARATNQTIATAFVADVETQLLPPAAS